MSLPFRRVRRPVPERLEIDEGGHFLSMITGGFLALIGLMLGTGLILAARRGGIVGVGPWIIFMTMFFGVALPFAAKGTWIALGRGRTVIDATRRCVQRRVGLLGLGRGRTFLFGQFSEVQLRKKSDGESFECQILLVRRGGDQPVRLCTIQDSMGFSRSEAEALGSTIARLTSLPLTGASLGIELGPIDVQARLDQFDPPPRSSGPGGRAAPAERPTAVKTTMTRIWQFGRITIEATTRTDAGPQRHLSRVAWVFPLVGALALAIGIADALRTSRFLREAERATGTVVALRDCGEGGSEEVVEFQPSTGRRVRVVDRGCGQSIRAVGDTVTVYYLPGAPRDARLGWTLSLWSLPIVSGGVGSVFLAVGLGVAVARRRSRPLGE